MNLLRPLAWTMTGAGVALVLLGMALLAIDRRVSLVAVGCLLFGAAAALIGLSSRSQSKPRRPKR